MDKIVFHVLVFLLSVHVFMYNSLKVVHGTTTSPLCDQTPYPSLCHPLFPTETLATLDDTQLAFRNIAIGATLEGAQQAHSLISTMDLSSFDQRAKLAWSDCLELYEDAVIQVNRSLSSYNPTNAQTWLSTAIANYQTCQNGFNDFQLSSHLKSFPPLLSDFSKLLSNSLAINKATASLSTSLSIKKTRGRHLLSDGFPEWLSVADRRLLQSSSTTSNADVVVAQDGSGNYKTITEAVVAAGGKDSGRRFVIHVKAGVYKENVQIKRSMKNVMLVGDGMGATVVTGSKSVQDGSTTYGSATFGVSGDGFIARDITFENTAGPQKYQAVAFRSGSDFSVFYGCAFKGYQDTLYVYAQRQFYRDCDIYGTIDFIFGDAVAILQNCNIYVRKPMSNQLNTITAQGRTDPNENTGIVIHNSRITAASDLRPVQGSIRTYLGRPWQKYSRTVIMRSALDGLINSAGWAPWTGSFALSTLYYGEYMNTGAGASTGGRVKWGGFHLMTSLPEAEKFTVGNFLAGSGWISATGVPFTSGL